MLELKLKPLVETLSQQVEDLSFLVRHDLEEQVKGF